MKKQSYIAVLMVSLFVILLLAGITTVPVRAEKKPTYIPLLGDQKKRVQRTKKKIRVQEVKTESDVPIMIGAGGGFFSALGSMNDSLQPGFFTGKVFIQYYRLPVQRFGAGMEISTAYLKDREIDGGMLYFHYIPYFCLNFEPFDIIELQGRAGGGMTWLRSDIKAGTEELINNSHDFTFYTGFAVMKTFSKHYMVGLEAAVYYYFERSPSASYGINFIFAYHL